MEHLIATPLIRLLFSLALLGVMGDQVLLCSAWHTPAKTEYTESEQDRKDSKEQKKSGEEDPFTLDTFFACLQPDALRSATRTTSRLIPGTTHLPESPFLGIQTQPPQAIAPR